MVSLWKSFNLFLSWVTPNWLDPEMMNSFSYTSPMDNEDYTQKFFAMCKETHSALQKLNWDLSLHQLYTRKVLYSLVWLRPQMKRKQISISQLFLADGLRCWCVLMTRKSGRFTSLQFIYDYIFSLFWSNKMCKYYVLSYLQHNFNCWIIYIISVLY